MHILKLCMKQLTFFILLLVSLLPLQMNAYAQSYWVENNVYKGAVFSKEIKPYCFVTGIYESYTPTVADVEVAEHILRDSLDLYLKKERICTRQINRNNLYLYNRQYCAIMNKETKDIIIDIYLYISDLFTKEALLTNLVEAVDAGEDAWRVSVNISQSKLYNISINSTENGELYTDCCK